MIEQFKVGQTDYVDVLNTLATAAQLADIEGNKIASQAAATAAAASAADALTSKNSAETSATTAATKSGEASTSATNAAASATTATTKAGEAATSAATATTKATLATTKATEAATSATSALDSLNAMSLIFDNFDDRFLGTKTSDPTLDNDGNPILAGTCYYNSVSKSIRFYNGISWDDPSASATASATSATASADTATSQAGIATTKAGEASTSATNAAASATTATTKAAAANTSATNAATSEANAASSASSASTSASTATTKAGEASTSATNAAASATTATTKAGEASTSASTATTKAAQATQAYNDSIAIYGSLSAVQTAATNAANSATSASNSASTATTQASTSIAKAAEASNYADAALAQATIATTKASEAETSATTATTKAGEASTSASNAASSATTATTKAGEAAASAASVAGFDLTIGTVTQGSAAATITGTIPNRVLNLTIPKGDPGSAVAIKNGGTVITSAVTEVNFTGAGVTATNSGNAVTVTIPSATATSVGLGNVDNTSDDNKPVSTAQQAALNLKLNAANPSYTGTLTGGAGVINIGSNQFAKDANGNIGIGTGGVTGTTLSISKSITGSTQAFVINNSGTIQSDVTSVAFGMNIQLATAAASFTISTLNGVRVAQGTVGAGSTITSQYAFHAAADYIGATNNYGFFGNIPAGANRWNMYMGGTANNHLAGKLWLGTTAPGNVNLANNLALTGGTTAYGLATNPDIKSDVTASAIIYNSYPTTQAASFTLPSLQHYSAGNGTFGAGSSVTAQYGFFAEASLIGATANYGFFGNIPSGAGRWNLFMQGTAANHLAGNTLIGGNADTGEKLQVTGDAKITGALSLAGKTLLLGGNFTTSGTFTSTFTMTGNTSVTFPTTGTLATVTDVAVIAQNIKSANYTLVLSDAGLDIIHPSADTTARTFTIPANASVPFPLGTAITFTNMNGAGAVTIAISSDVMRLAGAGTTGSRTLAANGVATARKLTATEWQISGAGLT